MIRNLRKRDLFLVLGLATLVGLWIGNYAGNLEPPGPPAPTMVTLDELARPPKPDLCFDNTGNRLVDCGNGTVKDTVTGLFWLKNADCFGFSSWAAANIAAAQLADGQCGLTDGSLPGDWRLPTLGCPLGFSCPFSTPPTGEFASIFAASCPAPFILNTGGTGCWSEGDPFSGVQSTNYWSSITNVSNPVGAMYASFLIGGNVFSGAKLNGYSVWPVRGGQ